MKGKVHVLLASVAIVAGFGVAGSAFAGGLLGSVKNTVNSVTNAVTETVGSTVDTVTTTVGDLTGTTGSNNTGTNIGDIVSINDPSDTALVDLDIGGETNVVSAAVGGKNPAAKLGVKTTGLLATTTISLDLLGLGLDVDLDLDILNPGGGDPDDPTNPNNPNNPNNPGRPVLVGSLGDGATFQITCAVNNTKQLLQVAANGKITAAEIKAWQRFANVQIIPIKLCPAAKKQVAQILARSQKVNLLQRAVMQDQLIMASLSRTKYDASDVVAVQRQKGQLVVYVY